MNYEIQCYSRDENEKTTFHHCKYLFYNGMITYYNYHKKQQHFYHENFLLRIETLMVQFCLFVFL